MSEETVATRLPEVLLPGAAPDREQQLVELVDEQGDTVGVVTVEVAHTSPGLAHRAFSVLLLDGAGRMLLQQRAAVKTRFPLRWANACCGHPAPAQTVTEAAAARLSEELGVTGVELTPLGVHRYRAEDPVTGRVEHEHDHVLLGRLAADAKLDADPAEVADTRWADPASLPAAAEADPGAYAPWLLGVTRLMLERPM
ncbi:isopentenyl-diphosphate Delta-isomerase [Catellatospora sp. NPDC049609]|uniref:isopentenyl-diphosphate Delta-isomerase n=1 Tax=Catellatospora sp. NPDC049609 TaxID=3155505 RepID=UPI003449AFD7